jgi:hypothetical protein
MNVDTYSIAIAIAIKVFQSFPSAHKNSKSCTLHLWLCTTTKIIWEGFGKKPIEYDITIGSIILHFNVL